MTSILDWKREKIHLDPIKTGKLIETFVFQELAAQIDLDSDYSLHHYRDNEKREIDFLIKKRGESLVGIEVKSSRNISKKSFASQIWFKKNIIKDKMPYQGIILYTGEDTLSFGDGMLAVPIAALWNNTE
jgi:predicted AAA+ superfamily ATPase